MEDRIISLETAKLAKEKKFNWEVNHYYDNENFLNEFKYYHVDRTCETFSGYPEDLILFASTQSLLQKWLREIHNIHIVVEPIKFDEIIEYQSLLMLDEIENEIEDEDLLPKNIFLKYEEALENALQEALNLIKI